MKIKITVGESEAYIRQLPGGNTAWEGKELIFDERCDNFDWWVICHSSSIRTTMSTSCDPNHIVFISMEPPDAGRNNEFLSQFSHVISCDSKIKHPKLILRNGVTWWAGLNVRFEGVHKISKHYNENYDSFKSMGIPLKKNRISIITSNKNYFPGHQNRLKFIKKLKNHPVSKHIDFFGGGENPIDDKLDGLLPYKYHIALENSCIRNYWTEKFADPILAYCLPLYYGCNNMVDYFPNGGFIQIDIEKFDDVVKLLENLIEADVYHKYIPELTFAREMIMDKYNIFQLISDVCDGAGSQYKNVTINPMESFKIQRRSIFERVKSFSSRILRI